MRYREKKTTNGALFLDIVADDQQEKIFCIVILAIYSTPYKDGCYKTFEFSTLKAANKKFNSLIDKI